MQSAEPAGRKTSVSFAEMAEPPTCTVVGTLGAIVAGSSVTSGGEGGGEGSGGDVFYLHNWGAL